MTAREYDDYVARVNQFFTDNDLNNLSAKCNDDETGCVEPHFSWRPCEVCGQPLGGDRYDCDGYSETHGVMEFSACTDCVYFAEYGELDDTTMMDVEKDREQNPAPMQEE